MWVQHRVLWVGQHVPLCATYLSAVSPVAVSSILSVLFVCDISLSLDLSLVLYVLFMALSLSRYLPLLFQGSSSFSACLSFSLMNPSFVHYFFLSCSLFFVSLRVSLSIYILRLVSVYLFLSFSALILPSFFLALSLSLSIHPFYWFFYSIRTLSMRFQW